MEGVKQRNLKAILTFIDFRKAFDTIHREKMMKILRAYGIPGQLVKGIENMYSSTCAKVISPDGETQMFEIKAGVLQRDTLAPYLFIIVLDYAMRKAIVGKEEELGFTLEERRSRRVHPITITDLNFADDLVLLSNEIDQAQEILTRVESELGKINAGKTKFIACNEQNDDSLTTIDGRVLEKVEDYKYLGAWIKSSDKDLKIRKAMAWKACNKMTKIWKSSLQRNFKIRLFKATVEAVLLYGSETWTLTATMEKQLNGCYTRLLRAALGIDWRQRVTNEELYAGMSRVTERVKERRLVFAGHCYRRIDEAVSGLVLWMPKRGTANRGRSCMNFVDRLVKDSEDLPNAMKERLVWRKVVGASCVRSTRPP